MDKKYIASQNQIKFELTQIVPFSEANYLVLWICIKNVKIFQYCPLLGMILSTK